MSAAEPLSYPERAGRYIRQRGGVPDEHRLLYDQVTPRQRRRMFRKERRSWRHWPRVALQSDGSPYDWGGATDDLDDYDYDVIDDEPGYCMTPGCDCCGGDDE